MQEIQDLSRRSFLHHDRSTSKNFDMLPRIPAKAIQLDKFTPITQ